MTQVTLNLPDELARKARAKGIFTKERAAAMVERELNASGKGQVLLESMKKLHALKLPPMSMDEIQSEVSKARKQIRNERARRS